MRNSVSGAVTLDRRDSGAEVATNIDEDAEVLLHVLAEIPQVGSEFAEVALELIGFIAAADVVVTEADKDKQERVQMSCVMLRR